MLPHTARKGDLVEVIYEDHGYYGLVGKLVSREGDNVFVDFYGKQIQFLATSLELKARVGTSKHKDLTEIIESKQTNSLTWRDLNDLMNHALDVGEYKWAYDLKQRRDKK